MHNEIKKFILDFLKQSDRAAEDIDFEPLPADGSTRVFWRITTSAKKSCLIAMSNPPTDNVLKRENFAYAKIGNHLRLKGIRVPEIYQYDLERGLFIMEDMGRTNLQQIVSSNKEPLPLYDKVLEHLFRMQVEGARDFDTKWCCQTARYDQTVMRRYETDYFKEAFLCRFLGLKQKWPELEAPFNHLSETASKADGNFFLHRDFQSRNIIVSAGSIGIIDWQGGRLGPLGYDLASLIIDPYADLPSQDKEKIYQRYLALIREHNAGWIEPFEKYFLYLAILRNLQILGAFSYLSKAKGKTYFEAYIPTALKTLHDMLHQLNDRQLLPLRDLIADLEPFQKSLDIPGPGG
ncbi:MAG: phosphotransferase [Deltaproteobacteria bacterium]|nr:phosphotransferase [Deltaproteobacteria bacterium]MBW1909169.1 phosphotransferase [Deltaproteobacteria bacterium]MBW2032622.1 phosphotransferase [Deltaproteobacteria bacterium]MBW2113529.1 phosphotransferase [Deltaproteobacteria bacterium]